MSALDSWLAGIASTPSPPADRADRKSSPAAPGDFDRVIGAITMRLGIVRFLREKG